MSREQALSAHYRSLPLEINAATKSQHTQLNHLITSRLRLCLPPNTSTTDLYTTGLSVFGTIYTAFEKEWQRFLEEDDGGGEVNRIICMLELLHIPRLLRSDWLRNDLMLLEDNDPTRSKMSENILQCYRNAVAHPIREKPTRILAYTWVMYMALFNGGRWIRDQLEAAGPKFWHTGREGQVDIDCLAFWKFEGDNNGDDIKNDFRKRFDSAASQLTEAERADVVRTAVGIFQMCHGMVDWLDGHATDDMVRDPGAMRLRQSGTWFERTAFRIWYGILTALNSILETFNLGRRVRYTALTEKDEYTE